KLGKLADALASYQQGLSKAASLRAVAKIAREQIDALKPRIPTLTVSVARPPPGLTVTIDDAPLAASAFRTALPVDLGPHPVCASAPGSPPRELPFTAAERSSTRFELALAPIAARIPDKPAVAPAPPPPAPPASKVPGIVAIAAGAAALGAGAALIGISGSKD